MAGNDEGRARGTRRAARTAVAAAAAALLGGGLLAAPVPARAAATAACDTRPTVRHVDWTSMTFTGDVVCPHNLGSVRLQSTAESPTIGRIVLSPSWFVCWKRGGDYRGQDIWYYTQGDTVSGSKLSKGWGYLPAAELLVPAHPVPGLAQCPWN